MRKPPSVVLITFAGRQDRMGLLKHYVEQALSDGTVDEWHVWNCARAESDALWVPAAFPALRATADDRNYQLAHVRVPVAPAHRVSFALRTGHDAHVAFIPDGGGPTYELVIGGWGNSGVGIRVWPAGALPDHSSPRAPEPSLIRGAPGVLSRRFWRKVDVELTRAGEMLRFAVTVDGRDVLLFETADATPAPFHVAVMSGYGNTAEWRFAAHGDARTGLFYPTLDKRFHPWNPVYRFYAERGEEYADTIFLKCDDDIIYLDRERLADFIAFRRRRRDYFVVSANVVNNGVCGFVQQEMGVIPRDILDLEMPPGGLRGSLWESGAKAAALHQWFLADPERFRRPPLEHFDLHSRISINFIAWLGTDLPSLDTRFTDDEHDLTVTIPNFLGRRNTIYLPFVASHLSFRPQDADMDVGAILSGYRALAGV